MKHHGFCTLLLLQLCIAYDGGSAPRLTLLGRTNSQASVMLEGESKGSYVLYASTNLNDWVPCTTNTSFYSQRVVQFAASDPVSFYRALRLPMPLFSFAIAAKGQIDLKGNNITSDSFDSTLGPYNPVLNRHDQGDIATTSGLTNSLNVGNAQIWGHIFIGPKGSVRLGPNGSVGDTNWHNDFKIGIEPGFYTDDMNVEFIDVQPPFNGGYMTPAAGTNNGVYYDYLLGSGTYQLDTLMLSGAQILYVTNNATLYVTGNISVSGSASIIVETGACLKIYCSGATADIAGNGVINKTGNATNFTYWGLPSNTTLSLGGSSAFLGTIYAPQADFTLNGSGGSSVIDFTGASVTSSVVVNGNFRFHYDEALVRSAFHK